MDVLERLKAINEARDKVRATYPKLVAFLDEMKVEFPNGEGHFYPKGKEFLEPKGVTADKMVLESLRPRATKKRKKPWSKSQTWKE